jgi:hypothetical protein
MDVVKEYTKRNAPPAKRRWWGGEEEKRHYAFSNPHLLIFFPFYFLGLSLLPPPLLPKSLPALLLLVLELLLLVVVVKHRYIYISCLTGWVDGSSALFGLAGHWTSLKSSQEKFSGNNTFTLHTTPKFYLTVRFGLLTRKCELCTHNARIITFLMIGISESI